MATSIIFKGKKKILPGIYAEIKSGTKNPTVDLSYNNIMIIDNGIGAGMIGGSGIDGAYQNGKGSIYVFDDIEDYRDHVSGGELWLIGEKLFSPAGPGIPGAGKVFVVKSCVTTPAEISYTLTNGVVKVKTRHEGVGSNGVITTGSSPKLSKGFGAKMVASPTGTGYIFRFYRGTFRGIDPLNGTPYNDITDVKSTPELICESPAVTTIVQLKAWMAKDYTFQSYFEDTSTFTTTGGITPADLSASVGWKKAIGGTETYNTTYLDQVLEAIKDVDNTFFLSDVYGSNAQASVNNTKILDHCINGKYDRFLFIGGGQDSPNGIHLSIGLAEEYDNDNAVIVHGGAKGVIRNSPNFKIFSSFYKAATVLGRIAGLTPQTPATLKRINIDGEVSVLSEPQQEQLLEAGVLATYYDSDLENYVILQGVNTLQDNEFLVNDDGTSFSIAVGRIASQLNKEIIYNAKKRFFGDDMTGPNRNTITPEDIKAWLEGFLKKKTASTLLDNLIIRFANIKVVVTEDNYKITYEFVPNFEVNKMVMTGFILDK